MCQRHGNFDASIVTTSESTQFNGRRAEDVVCPVHRARFPSDRSSGLDKEGEKVKPQTNGALRFDEGLGRHRTGIATIIIRANEESICIPS